MNKKKVLRVMHKYNITPPRLWYQKKFTTSPNMYFDASKLGNVLKNVDLRYGACDVWYSDLTYIKYDGAFYYLAIIQDMFTREIVGFNISNKHDSNLVIKTLKEAIIKADRPPKIFHSDRGREYLSDENIKLLEKLNIQISVSDPGSPWQNGMSESFFSRFKTESGPLSRFETLGELVEYVCGYIHYYNTKRIHTSLKTTPYKFKQNLETDH